MENDINYKTAQNYSAFETASKKLRNRRKRRPVPKRRSDINSDTSNNLESPEYVGDPNFTDEASGIDDLEDSNKDSVNFDYDEDNPLYRTSSRVSLDAMMKSLPTYEIDDTVLVVENKVLESETLSTVDKQIIEDIPVVEEPKEETVINTRALPKEAITYQLEKFEKNALIIFNQVNIDGHLSRLGTEKDVNALTRTFSNYGFEVTSHDDLTKDELFKELKTFSEKDFTDYGCVAVAVLTHGSNNGLLRAKDQQYSEIEIINMFKGYNKPSLVTKPKIIIIQACRGTKIMQGVPVLQMGKTRKDIDEDLEPYILPNESDLLILHSSYVGSPAHRNELYGSWFIQALCNKISSLAATHDFESIITEVKREVAINRQHEEYNKKTLTMDINKQMPVMTSTLIRKLYIKRFRDQAMDETFADKLRSVSDSRHEVLDTLIPPVTPSTPLLVQLGPCFCFLDHFTYLRNCLAHFVEENPNDDTAQSFLNIANTFDDNEKFYVSKESMTKAISKHLHLHARSSPAYKYLYFYKHAHMACSFK